MVQGVISDQISVAPCTPATWNNPANTYSKQSESRVLKSRSYTVIAMVEKQSEIGRDAQLAMLLRHKWQAEIEKDVTKERKK